MKTQPTPRQILGDAIARIDEIREKLAPLATGIGHSRSVLNQVATARKDLHNAYSQLTLALAALNERPN